MLRNLFFHVLVTESKYQNGAKYQKGAYYRTFSTFFHLFRKKEGERKKGNKSILAKGFSPPLTI